MKIYYGVKCLQRDTIKIRCRSGSCFFVLLVACKGIGGYDPERGCKVAGLRCRLRARLDQFRKCQEAGGIFLKIQAGQCIRHAVCKLDISAVLAGVLLSQALVSYGLAFLRARCLT